MKLIQKRILAFLLLCIPTRVLFVFISKNIDKNKLKYLGYLALLPAIGFLIAYFSGRNRGATFGQDAWWHSLRPIHSLLYFTFAYLAINKKNNAYIPLLIDVVFGLISFLNYHYHLGSFKF